MSPAYLSPAYIAAKSAERRRAEQAAEFARQIPLYREESTEPPAEYLEYLERDEDDVRPMRAPRWTTDY